MKNIQSLTLMMAVMVYAAPTTTLSPEDKEKVAQLTAIIDRVNILLRHNKELNFTVPGVILDTFPTCTKEFFCLAEKSLKTSTEIKANLTETVEELQRQLIQYNIRTNVNCPDTTGEHWMKPFLADIKKCSVHEIEKAHHG